MARIGIFGGSFDPVHVDHENMCRIFKSELLLDEVRVIPARLSPFKNVCCASAEDRLNMLRLAFAGNEGIIVDRCELDSVETNYSYLTVQKIKSENPADELFFLIGADSLRSFPRWRNPEIIASCATVCVAERKDENADAAADVFEKKYGYKPIVLSFEGTCSSTEARERLWLGLDTDGCLSPSVRTYIQNNELYPCDEIHEYLRKNLKTGRLYHTVGVMITAIKYAKETGADVEKAKLAALLHDVAKYSDPHDFPAFTVDGNVPEPIIHQYLGAFIAENVLGVDDPEVLGAIRWHTTGRPDMTLLEKIIYTADLLEPGRNFEGVKELRAAVDKDFETGFRFCVRELLKFLEKSGTDVYYMSVLTDKYYNGNAV